MKRLVGLFSVWVFMLMIMGEKRGLSSGQFQHNLVQHGPVEHDLVQDIESLGANRRNMEASVCALKRHKRGWTLNKNVTRACICMSKHIHTHLSI